MPTLNQQFQSQGFLVLERFVPIPKPAMPSCFGPKHSSDLIIKDIPPYFRQLIKAKAAMIIFWNRAIKSPSFFEKDAFDEKVELKQDLFHSLNKIGHALHDLDPMFASFSRSKEMRELAAELGLEDHVLIQSMMIFKHAKIGGKVDVHQDATFLYTEPQSCIGFWFALEDATIENGCMWAAAGGHKTSLRSRFQRKEGGGTEMQILDEQPYDINSMKPLEVPKGSCIVLLVFYPITVCPIPAVNQDRLSPFIPFTGCKLP
ncbi:MAG: phytanoyl-CoA dioxygenase family protein [Bacteroidetes bacterium]|nr:phytanoyl-CoA dioxygenase family protein [Bacteroidota bacterium]